MASWGITDVRVRRQVTGFGVRRGIADHPRLVSEASVKRKTHRFDDQI
jgi:hypothetical protein